MWLSSFSQLPRILAGSTGKFGSLINQKCFRRSPQMSYWKVIMSVRLSVGALGFKGWFVMLPLS